MFCLFLLPVFVWASQLLSLCAYFLFLLHLFFSHKVWASAGAAFLPGLLRSSAVVLYFLASFYGGNSVFFLLFCFGARIFCYHVSIAFTAMSGLLSPHS